MEAILNHRKRGRGYLFLSLMKGDPQHEVQWQSTRDFVEPDSTNQALVDYLHEHGLDPPLMRASTCGRREKCNG